MTVLVYGATGTQGAPLTRRLRARGTAVRGIARSPQAAANLRDLGADVVSGDLRDADSLVSATKGVDAVFVQLPASVAAAELVEFTERALRAVAANGSPHTVITTSSIFPESRSGVPYPDAKLRVVELAREITPHAVILYPGVYMDNLAGPLRDAVQAGMIPYPIPVDVPVAWLSVDDAAAFAVAALDRPDLAGQAFPIGGPEALTGPQLAEQLSQALGRTITYQAIPPAGFREALVPVLGAAAAQEIADFYQWSGDFGADLLAPDLAATLAALPVPRTTVRDWAPTAFR